MLSTKQSRKVLFKVKTGRFKIVGAFCSLKFRVKHLGMCCKESLTISSCYINITLLLSKDIKNDIDLEFAQRAQYLDVASPVRV